LQQIQEGTTVRLCEDAVRIVPPSGIARIAGWHSHEEDELQLEPNGDVVLVRSYRTALGRLAAVVSASVNPAGLASMPGARPAQLVKPFGALEGKHSPGWPDGNERAAEALVGGRGAAVLPLGIRGAPARRRLAGMRQQLRAQSEAATSIVRATTAVLRGVRGPGIVDASRVKGTCPWPDDWVRLAWLGPALAGEQEEARHGGGDRWGVLLSEKAGLPLRGLAFLRCHVLEPGFAAVEAAKRGLRSAVSAHEMLLPLRGTCMEARTANWTAELCVGGRATYTRTAAGAGEGKGKGKGKAKGRGLVGEAVTVGEHRAAGGGTRLGGVRRATDRRGPVLSAQRPYIAQVFGRGAPCDPSRPEARGRAEIRLHCAPGERLASDQFDENESCGLLVTAGSALVCAHPLLRADNALRPPSTPIASDPSLDMRCVPLPR